MTTELIEKFRTGFHNIETRLIKLKPVNYGYPEFCFIEDFVYEKWDKCLSFSGLSFLNQRERQLFELYCRNNIEGQHKSYNSIRP